MYKLTIWPFRAPFAVFSALIVAVFLLWWFRDTLREDAAPSLELLRKPPGHPWVFFTPVGVCRVKADISNAPTVCGSFATRLKRLSRYLRSRSDRPGHFRRFYGSFWCVFLCFGPPTATTGEWKTDSSGYF